MKGSGKNYLKTVMAIALLLVLNVGIAQTGRENSNSSKADTLRLLLIGNSFSQNAGQYLPQLAREGNHPLVIGRAEIGGCSLEKHWDLAQLADANPSEPNGKPYKGKSLRMILSQGKWTVVTLQQNSMNSGYVATYSPYAKNLYDYIKSIQPGARIVFHQTWAYRSDSKDFTLIAENQHAKDSDEMFHKLREAYLGIASSLDIKVMPVGDAFHKVSSSKKWGYKPNAEYDFSHPVYPNLPNQAQSLHRGYYWDKDQKLGFDSHHANEAGCFLGSLVWYTFLFGESPEKITFVPKQVSPEFAKYLKKIANSVVK